VLDEGRATAFYGQAFGLRVDTRLDFETITRVYPRNAEVDLEVELTVSKGRTKSYNLGGGYGDLAFVVDDLEAEHRRLTNATSRPHALRAVVAQPCGRRQLLGGGELGDQ
jgi:lactoylglutathione lyase